MNSGGKRISIGQIMLNISVVTHGQGHREDYRCSESDTLSQLSQCLGNVLGWMWSYFVLTLTRTVAQPLELTLAVLRAGNAADSKAAAGMTVEFRPGDIHA